MYTKTRKHKIIILLLVLMLTVRFSVYGQPAENRQQNETELPDNQRQTISMPSSQGNHIHGRFMELMTAFLPSSKAEITRSDSSGKNPFTPLVAEQTTEDMVNEISADRATEQAKSRQFPVIRLTATFISTGLQKRKPTVIVEESGISRSISVGDTIAGMTIAEIQRGRVILSRGDKKCVMTLGLLPEEASTNGL